MSIARMKKLTLVGLNDERSKILKTLHHMGCVEISSIRELDNTKNYSDLVYKDKISTKLSKINFTFTFLKDMRIQAIKLGEKYKKLALETEPVISDASEGNENKTELIAYMPPKKPFLLGLPSVDYNEFQSIDKREEELFEVIEKIEQLNSKLIDIKSDMIRLNSLIEQLSPYLGVDAKFSLFTDTKNTSIMLGLVQNNKLKVIDSIKEAFPEAEIEIINSTRVSAIVIIIGLHMKEEILTRLVEADYVQSNFHYDMTAEEKYNQCKAEYQELERRRENIISEVVGFDKFIRELEILYDYYLLELKKANADDHFRFTESSFTMQGWFPVEVEDQLVDKLNKSYKVFIETSEPIGDEIVPTLTRNNSLVSPYEDIVNMYSTPNSREIDPNPFVAIFYFIFFGMMVSDAGYGMILAIGAFLLYRYAKPRKGEGKLVLVIAMGGISTIIWGFMFGGIFGIQIPPLMFNPMEQPLAMLGLSLGMGIIQILFGMGIHAVALFRQKKYMDAICNIFGWYAVFLGLGLFALSMVPNFSFMKNIGVVAALVGVLGVFIGGGLEKKGILGKAMGGLGNLYSITSFLSDILSYSRLFGLGLATGVVGMVFNELGKVAIDLLPYGLGYLIAIPVFIVGHLFNLGINTLGAYVHNSRLQYIEFFSRFYTGSGHQFVPFGTNTKYFYIDN